MKKLLVVLLACVMVFGFAANAFAADTQLTDFSDVADQSYAAQVAIYRLAALGVLEGYGDGTFLPAQNITRAEMTKIAVFAEGKSDMEGLMKTAVSPFSDVTVGFWATGWINIAAQDSIVQGYPGGTFRSQNNVTQAEAVTMAMRLAGFTDALNGDWPYDYLRAAQTMGVLDDVTLRNPDGSSPATRAEVAIIFNEMLINPIVKYDANSVSYLVNPTLYDQDADRDRVYRSNDRAYELGLLVTLSNENKFVDTGYDMLEKAFGCEAIEMNFQSADFAYVWDSSNDEFDEYNDGKYYENAAWGYDDRADGELLLYGMIAELDYDGDFDEWLHTEYEVATKYYVMGSDFPGLENARAEVIRHIDDNEILFIEKTSTEQLVREVKDATKGSSVKLDGETVKFEKDHDYLTDWLDYAFYDADDETAEYGKAYLNKDGEIYDFVYMDLYLDYENYPENYVTTNQYLYNDVEHGMLPDADWVEEIDDDDYIVLHHGEEIDLEDAADYLVYKDGKFAELADIEAGDVVFAMNLNGVDDGCFLVVHSLEEATLNKAKAGEFELGDAYFSFYGNGADENDLHYAFDEGLVTYFGLEGVDESLDPFNTRDEGDSSVNGYTAMNSAYDEDVLYGVSYDFTKLAVIISDTDVAPSLGVVVEYVTGNNDRLTEVSIFTTEGKETPYKLDGTAYYDHEFEIGDLVEFDTNKDGKITVDSNDVAKIRTQEYDNVDYADRGIAGTAGSDTYWTSIIDTYNELDPDDLEFTYDINNKHNIVFGDPENSLRLSDTAKIFNVSLRSNGNFSDVELVKASDILSRDDYSGDMILYATNKDHYITKMYVINGEDTYGNYYGIAKDYTYNNSKGEITVIGFDGKETTVKFNKAFTELADHVDWRDQAAFMAYRIASDGRMDYAKIFACSDLIVGSGLHAVDSDWQDSAIVGHPIADLTRNSLSIEISHTGTGPDRFVAGVPRSGGNYQYYLDDSTVFYDFANDKEIKRADVKASDWVYLVVDGDDVVYCFVIAQGNGIAALNGITFHDMVYYRENVIYALNDRQYYAGVSIGTDANGVIDELTVPSGAVVTIEQDVKLEWDYQLYDDVVGAVNFNGEVIIPDMDLGGAGTLDFVMPNGAELENGTFYAKSVAMEDSFTATSKKDMAFTFVHDGVELALAGDVTAVFVDALFAAIDNADGDTIIANIDSIMDIEITTDVVGLQISAEDKNSPANSFVIEWDGTNWVLQ